MAQPVSAIFLDRDGTLNVDHGYVHEIDEFQFIDGVIDACLKLKEMFSSSLAVKNIPGSGLRQSQTWVNSLTVPSG